MLVESEIRKKEEINAVIGILKKAAKEIQDCEDRAEKAFITENGINILEIEMQQKARLVLELAKDLEEYFKNFPKIARKIKRFEKEAKQYIIEDNFFGLCMLLDNRFLIDAPKNELEQLLEKIEK